MKYHHRQPRDGPAHHRGCHRSQLRIQNIRYVTQVSRQVQFPAIRPTVPSRQDCRPQVRGNAIQPGEWAWGGVEREKYRHALGTLFHQELRSTRRHDVVFRHQDHGYPRARPRGRRGPPGGGRPAHAHCKLSNCPLYCESAVGVRQGVRGDGALTRSVRDLLAKGAVEPEFGPLGNVVHRDRAERVHHPVVLAPNTSFPRYTVPGNVVVK
mmetsp:Transcript_8439/g.23809  ORF Transcript_8439/g.23809 Transcript_8439/m.23809 type:complete len:210 (+) Transcript_8439:1334-1963(+)